MKKLYLILFALLLSISAFSQTVQREFRATWLATVSGIDWPRAGVGATTQKNDLITILNKLEAMNMNAVVLQVRPTADALYNSAYEPWSEWLTGTRGNNPGFDPLAFALEEAHKRGMELHVWLNPYRFETSAGRYTGKPGDYMATNPDWMITYSNKTYFNPGIPAVTKHIKKIVGDIISKYDIDGVLFDDYFYPEGISTEDASTYATYNWNSMSLKDFRRASVNKMIKAVNDTIKSINPAMRFGVSPAGVYTNTAAAASHGTTVASGISGWDVYNAIYCDALAWLSEGSVDYLSPQIYWDINDAGQEYNVLTEWWGKECKRFGKHCYPSIGVYRLAKKSTEAITDINGIEQIMALQSTSDAKAYSLQEIVDEINVNRNNAANNVHGCIFFSTKQITGSVAGLGEYIYQNAFQKKAIFKDMSWLTSPAPTIPTVLSLQQNTADGIISLSWTGSDPMYAIFGVNPETKATSELLKIAFTNSFSLKNVIDYGRFAVAAINDKGELSALSNIVELNAPEKPILVTPLGETIAATKAFTWNTANYATSYTIDFYSDEALTNNVYSQNKLTNKTFTFSSTILEGQTTYYWQVTANNGLSSNKSTSASFFTGFPKKAEVTSLANNAIKVPIAGTFEWKAQTEATAYYMQLSRDAAFSVNYIVTEKEVTTNSAAYAGLLENTDYYLRVYAKNANGNGRWSEVVKFTTDIILPAAPAFTSPADKQYISNLTAAIAWSKVNDATGYKLQISNQSDFSSILSETIYNSYQRTFNYTCVANKEYYARVASNSTKGYGEWSTTLYFTTINYASIDAIASGKLKAFPIPTHDVLTIQLQNNQSINTLALYDINGRLINKQTIDMPEVNLNVESLEKGIYQLILLTNTNERLTLRFIKQ